MRFVPFLVTLVLVAGSLPVLGGPDRFGSASLQAQVPLTAGPQELPLDEAIRLARENNPDYLIQRRQVETAEMEVSEAWSAFLPSANISNSYGLQTSGERRVGDVSLGERPEILSSSYQFGLSLNLDGRALLRPGQARLEEDAAQARVEGAGMGLDAEVTDAYLSVLQADAQVEQARAELQRTQATVREAEARVEVGAATSLDVRRAQVQHGQAEVLLVQVENEAAATRLSLAELVGVHMAEDVELTTDFELFEPALDAAELVETALANNPAVRASRREAQVAEGEIRSSRSDYFPSLSLSAGVNASVFQAGSLSPLVDERLGQQQSQFESCVQDNRIRDLLGDSPRNCEMMNPQNPEVREDVRQQVEAENSGFPFDYQRQPWNLSLTVSLPLFTGFSRGRDTERARIAHADSREQVRSQELQLRSQVSQAVRAVETAHRIVKLQGTVKETAAEELRLAQERFRLGLSTSIDVVEAQANLSEAERDEITAVYDFHQAVADLEALLGGELR